MSNRKPKNDRKVWLSSATRSWSTVRDMLRRDRQRDRRIVSKEHPGFSDFKRREKFAHPGARRHAVSIEADRLKFAPEVNKDRP